MSSCCSSSRRGVDVAQQRIDLRTVGDDGVVEDIDQGKVERAWNHLGWKWYGA